MGRHIALLVGASDYRTAAAKFSSLDFIPAELDRLRTALLARGFDRVDVVARDQDGVGEVSASQISGAVRQILRDDRRVRAGDTVLILLSGHGVRHEGRDLLVPEGLHPWDNQTAASVEINWAADLEGCPAASVVFLMDTCREGVQEDTKSLHGLELRRRADLKADRRRNVARVFACSPLEVSRYARAGEVSRTEGAESSQPETGQPENGFSLFTRAVTELAEEGGPWVTLDGFLARVQHRIGELHTLYGKSGPAQTVDHQFTGPQALDTVLVFPGTGDEENARPRSYDDHPWTGIVTSHAVWGLVPPPLRPAAERLRTYCAAVAAHLAQVNDQCEEYLVNDPWNDDERPERAIKRLTQLLNGGLSAEKTAPLEELSPTEAALLVLTPFLTNTAHRRLAARLSSALAADTPEFVTFTGQYPRELRRMKQAERAENTKAVRQIRWWLFRRWLQHRSESYQRAAVEPLLPLPSPELPPWVAEALGPDRIRRMLNDLWLSPFALSPSGNGSGTATGGGIEATLPTSLDFVAAGEDDQHNVRERMVSTLLKTVMACAVTADSLPPVVVQNLGVQGQVDLDELLIGLRRAYWVPAARNGITLHVRSTNHSATRALETYCTQVDGLLRDVGDAAERDQDLRTLTRLPDRAGSDIEAPSHLREAVRFRADEERVLDLLMGRNLYKEPELALREMYQNALDACRHRSLRTEFLRRTGVRMHDWEGRITFTQGVDEAGRAFLRCEDTGIGMGVNEIRGAFSEAGSRFEELPEYVREMALWQQHAPDLRLYANSRFGIGVLSYFMLADEIVVETRRLGMDGSPGEGLRVSIAGPGTLFGIDPLSAHVLGESGTRVTLYLNPPEPDEDPLSCADALAQQLWVSPFRTEAVHYSSRAEWKPYELRAESLRDHQRDNTVERGLPDLQAPETVRAAEDGRVYWVSGPGLLLADGIRTDASTFGAVIDLRDDLRPETLSVDRVELRRYDEDAVRKIKLECLPSLIVSPVLTYEWVLGLGTEDEEFGDAVVQAAAAAGVRWDVAGREAAVADTGVFPPDVLLIRALTGESGSVQGRTHVNDDHILVACMPDFVLRWRFLCLLKAGFGGPVTATVEALDLPIAQPTDNWLLLGRSSASHWQERHEAWTRRGVRSAIHWDAGTPSPEAAELGAVTLDVLPRWRSSEVDVSTREILSWVVRTERSAREIVERCGMLGLRSDFPVALYGVRKEDSGLLTKVGQGGWLDAGASISLPQLLASAIRAEVTAQEAVIRLERLGFSVPEPPAPLRQLNSADLDLLDALFGSTQADASTGTPVLTPAHIGSAAASLRASPASVAARVNELGLEAIPADHPADPPTKDDLIILGLDLDGSAPWLAPEEEVPAPHLLAAAALTELTVEAVADRLVRYGFTVPAVLPKEGDLSLRDLLILSTRYGQLGRFLRRDKPVGAAHLQKTRDRFQIPVDEARTRLGELGYALLPENPQVERLPHGDFMMIAEFFPADYSGRDSHPLPSAHVRAAAHRLGRTPADFATHLTELGCVLDQPAEAFAAPTAANRLTDWLTSGQADLVDLAEDSWITLAELGSVAMLLGRPFREIAAGATACGFRHEAETWFAG